MKPARWLEPLLLGLILLGAAGLRFCALGAQSLWNDEGTSVAVAGRNLATIARDAANDIHPPLYYWLLHGWVRLVGTGEAAVRALSALLGVILVALVYALGRILTRPPTALVAAGLAAVNPFLVYYSQEARMYMLLALLSAAAVLALAHHLRWGSWPALAILVLLEAAGLYTHHSFAFVILCLNLLFLLGLRRGAMRRLVPWALSQAAVALLYLPWLPIALRQVRTWPSPEQAIALAPALSTAWRWLVFGPTLAAEQAAVLLLASAATALAGLLFLAGGRWLRGWQPERWPLAALAIWALVPGGLIFALGLYREAYLKFLLSSAPAVCLLLACGLSGGWGGERPARGPGRGAWRAERWALLGGQLLAGAAILTGAGLSLRNYYAEPAYARDNYRGIAAYIQALERPGDAIVLNAPGQQEVFGYYYRGSLPVYPLPTSRPLDPALTEQALADLVRPGGHLFAVLWATDESDPGRFIEGWLDAHLFKALDSWYGNVRLVLYAVPEEAAARPAQTLNVGMRDAETGDEVTLLGYRWLSDRVPAGDIAQLTLFWQAARTPGRRYRAFVHVLDEANHIVGQRDAEPGGGARLTTLWAPGETVVDAYGVPVHPATPPGSYRVEVGMYDLESGRRLATADGATQVWLEPLSVEKPGSPAPEAILNMQHPGGASFGALELLGYDAYRLGFAHAPDTPLHPGDILHLNLYWRARAQPGAGWQVEAALEGRRGHEVVKISGQPVVGYPTSEWRAGDVWRGQFDLHIPQGLAAGRYRLRIQAIAPDGPSGTPFLSEPLRIGP